MRTNPVVGRPGPVRVRPPSCGGRAAMGLSTTGAWLDDLHTRLTAQYGSAHGDQVFRRYAEAFPQTYCDTVSTDQAITDVSVLELSLIHISEPTRRTPISY